MGLYDDDDAAVTSGDQNHEGYWWAKYYSITLDEALKSRQPEGALKDFLNEYAVKYIDEALTKFPAHNDIKAWKEKAVKIQGKINPNAEYASFKPDFPWMGGPGGSGGGNFGQWWVSYHLAKAAKAAGDWATAYEKAKYCSFRAEEINEARFKSKYSEDIQKFLADSAAESNELFAEAKKKQ